MRISSVSFLPTSVSIRNEKKHRVVTEPIPTESSEAVAFGSTATKLAKGVIGGLAGIGLCAITGGLAGIAAVAIPGLGAVAGVIKGDMDDYDPKKGRKSYNGDYWDSYYP